MFGCLKIWGKTCGKESREENRDKKLKKRKNKFKINKLFLYAISNLFEVKNTKKKIVISYTCTWIMFKKKGKWK